MAGDGTPHLAADRRRTLTGALLSFVATEVIALFGVLFWVSSVGWVSPLDVVVWTPLVLSAAGTCLGTFATLGMAVRALAPRLGAGPLPAAAAYLLVGFLVAASTGTFGQEGLMGATRILFLWPLGIFLQGNVWMFGIEFPT